MIVYGASFSPFVRKVLAFAAEKGVAVESKQADRAPGSEFMTASPFGKMPALRDGEFTISDSTAIVTYLEALHPEPNLIPLEPKARARTIWYEEYADTILVSAGTKIVYNRVVSPRFYGRPGDLAAADEAQQVELPPLLDYLEKIIPASGFLVEDRLTLADIAVASPFATLALSDCPIDDGRHPRIKAYVEDILARPSFAPLIAAEKAMFAA